jgi:Ca2+-transporting ATPase
LTAVQILIVNLVTDTIPCVAIGLEPMTDDIMHLKPNKNKGLFDRYALYNIFGYGCLIAMLTLCAFSVGHFVLKSTAEAITMAFIVLAISQLFYAFNLRSRKLSAFSRKQPKDKLLLLTICISLLIILCLVLIPGLNTVLKLCYIN